MDTDEFDGAKINYETFDGRKTTAYLDKKLAEDLFTGTNKHTDEKVVVMWIEEDQKYVEWFEHDGEVMDWLRKELMREYQKHQLQDVIGPMTYGDAKNFEVYQDADLDWQIRPSKDYIGAQVRGIFDQAGIEKKEE